MRYRCLAVIFLVCVVVKSVLKMFAMYAIIKGSKSSYLIVPCLICIHSNFLEVMYQILMNWAQVSSMFAISAF